MLRLQRANIDVRSRVRVDASAPYDEIVQPAATMSPGLRKAHYVWPSAIRTPLTAYSSLHTDNTYSACIPRRTDCPVRGCEVLPYSAATTLYKIPRISGGI